MGWIDVELALTAVAAMLSPTIVVLLAAVLLRNGISGLTHTS